MRQHEPQSHQRHDDDMQAVKAAQRGSLRPSRRAARPAPGCPRRDAASDVRANGGGPISALVPGQQVTGEPEDQGQDEQQHAADPVQFARLLVGAHDENARHMGDAHHDHAVGRPVMDHADGRPKTDLVFDEQDAVIGFSRGGLVVEGQHDAGDALHHEQEGRDAAQAVPPIHGKPGDRLGRQFRKNGRKLVAFVHPLDGTGSQRLVGPALRPDAGGAVHAEEEYQAERAKNQPARERCPQVLVLACDVAAQARILSDGRRD